MEKIEKTPNLTELAYRSIKKLVLDGSLDEASRLTEESLSDQLGISKSPVREALNRLEVEGLISIKNRHGAFLRTFSPKEIRDLYDLRILLELHAIDNAKITPTVLNELKTSIGRTKEFIREGNRLGYIEEDLRFHSAIMTATDNGELCKVLTLLQQRCFLCRNRSYDLSTATTPSGHTNVYKALKEGSKVRAKAAMRDHIAVARDWLLASYEGNL